MMDGACQCILKSEFSASLKNNYPLPKMDQMLHQVVGSQRMSMLDGFLDYHQVRMDPEDVLKTTFTTLWGTFSYVGMPFWADKC